MCPLQIPKMAMMTIIAVIFLARVASSSRYIPRSWAEMCHRNISVSPTPGGVRPAIQVDLQCVILKSHKVQWKLNDLRAWTIDKGINNQTIPTNRTVIYNITVTCETGANISLPWPMRVAGLREIHVHYCFLLDKYSNFMDGIDSTIQNDMTILEIRHSTWIVNDTNQILMNSGAFLNLTSEFDCGQDSTLEISITSNVSNTMDTYENVDDIINSLENANSVGESETKSVEPGAESISGWPAKPEDQLIKDTAKVVSDYTNLRTVVESNNTTTKVLPKQQSSETDSTNIRTAEENYIKLIQQIIGTPIKCNFKKLVAIDESVTPVTPLHHFDLMVYGSDYPVLERMNYSYIGLKELPKQFAEWWIYFPKLTRVDLSHNYISEVTNISPSPSTQGTDIVIFDLRYNNITKISLDIIKSWAAAENVFLDIRDNPIHCECDLAQTLLPFLADESTFKGSLARYEYVKYLHCHTPDALHGEQLYRLTTDALQCPVYTSNMSVVIALSVILSILIIIMIVIIRYKVEIRILLYTRLHLRLPWDSNIQRNSKTFDAFISYSNEDAVWVHENLVKFLENIPSENPYVNKTCNHSNSSESANSNKSFKLCIHQRDFIPGKTIFDNIVDCIEASRHTIIVMSPSFIRSQWAMEELRQAYRQSLAEKTRYLIIILLEKVSKDEMDPLIRRCCRTFTYLDVNDHLFKDRLVFSLTTKRRNDGKTDRSVTKENNDPKWTSQNETNVYDKIAVTHTYDNVAYFSNSLSSHPSGPIRELSNMTTTSTADLASFWHGKTY